MKPQLQLMPARSSSRWRMPRHGAPQVLGAAVSRGVVAVLGSAAHARSVSVQ